MKAVLVFLIFCLLAVLLWLVDRGLLKAEERGWIYWRKKRGHSDRLGQAFLDLHTMLEPGNRHVIEEKRRDHDETAGEGAPPP
jgi:cbb3-type cytochrome oxidase subunit 3